MNKARSLCKAPGQMNLSSEILTEETKMNPTQPLLPAHEAQTCSILSNDGTKLHTVKVWPAQRAAVCECPKFTFSKGPVKTCHHCERALVLYPAPFTAPAPKPEPQLVAAPAVLSPFEKECEIERASIAELRRQADELAKQPGCEVSAAYWHAGANEQERRLETRIAMRREADVLAETIEWETNPDYEGGPVEEDFVPEQTAPSFPLAPVPAASTTHDPSIHNTECPFVESVHPSQKCGSVFRECLESAVPVVMPHPLALSLLMEWGPRA